MYKKLSPEELLTNIYGDQKFRKDFYKWLRIGGYPEHKREVNKVVIAYEYYLDAKLTSTFLGKLRYSDIDLVDYTKHEKQIKNFLTERSYDFN